MTEEVFVWMTFCITIVAIVGIVALVVYNRDKFMMHINAKANMCDKIKTEMNLDVAENEHKK
jgi:heme exporter protein D